MTTVENNHAPEVREAHASMSHICQPQTPRPVARWIVEDGQLLGVLVASGPSPLFHQGSFADD